MTASARRLPRGSRVLSLRLRLRLLLRLRLRPSLMAGPLRHGTFERGRQRTFQGLHMLRYSHDPVST
jgi:hypothetical protein|eukprot:jgi/Chrpa1/25650/Chrysochromulina_OHIO_Genome00006564-RA